MTDQEQIDALKAQVNCLREQLYIIYAAPRSANSFKDLQNYALESLQATPEQCLAEVKAQAIKEMVKNFNKDYFLGTNLLRKIENYTKELLEQAK